MVDQPITVSQLTYTIKNLLESKRSFKGFTLKGEISNFTRHRTGHLYFALKDESSQIKAIMFSSNARKLTFNPKEGDKVTVKGSISVYAPQGSYSINITSMNPEGAGELYQKYLELKKNLKELGWFDKEKRKVAKYPKRIGVVTSATGAVIQDITNTVNRRYRLTEIILYPSLVQGPGASESMAKQIKKANKDNLVDVLIVGRGGGSIEDLWGFNEMATIEAIYTSKLPVIAAIGHESDNTISDLVADLRAPTPTAAAELATPNTKDLIIDISNYVKDIKYKANNLINNKETHLIHLMERLNRSSPFNKIEDNKKNLLRHKRDINNGLRNIIIFKYNHLKQLILKLTNNSPARKLEDNVKKVNDLKENLEKSFYYKLDYEKQRLQSLKKQLKAPTNIIENYKSRLLYQSRSLNKNIGNILVKQEKRLNHNLLMLENLNPTKVMRRGFAILRDDETIITSVKNLVINSSLNIELSDGYIESEIKKIKKKENDNE